MDSTENKMPGTVQITPGEKSLDEGIVFVKPYAPSVYSIDEFDASEKSESEEDEDESLIEIHKVRTAQREGSPLPQAKSINFEDVDETNEGLVEMRGEGRYFGSIEEKVLPVCKKCGEKGHKAAKCSVIVCDSCGEKNDHISRNCPKSKRCSRCGQIGHLRVNCTEKAQPIYCHRCKLRTHTEETCPQIWRNYLVSRKAATKYPAKVSCYNCGEDGHYGDDCEEPRQVQLRFIDPSAFTGRSLSGKYRTKYDSSLRKHQDQSRNSYKGNMYEDDYYSRSSNNDNYDRYSSGNKRKYNSRDSNYDNGHRSKRRSSGASTSSGYGNLPSRPSYDRYDNYDESRSNSGGSGGSGRRQKFNNAGNKISKKFRELKDSTKRMFKRN